MYLHVSYGPRNSRSVALTVDYFVRLCRKYLDILNEKVNSVDIQFKLVFVGLAILLSLIAPVRLSGWRSSPRVSKC